MNNDKRTGYEEAARALTERAASHYLRKNYILQDECLQCAAMLHDMKPAADRATEAGTPAKAAQMPEPLEEVRVMMRGEPEYLKALDLYYSGAQLAAFGVAGSEEARREGYRNGMDHAKRLYEAGQSIAAAQRTAGGDAVAWRVREFDSVEGKHSDVWRLTPYRADVELFERYGAMIEPLGVIAPVPEAAAQADGGGWVSPKEYWEAPTAHPLAALAAEQKPLPPEVAAALSDIESVYAYGDAPTAQPTPEQQAEINAALDRADAEDEARYPAAQPTPPDDERAAFEKWAELAVAQMAGTQHDLIGWYYFDDLTNDRWEAWQARAALRQPPKPNFNAAPNPDAEDAALLLRNDLSALWRFWECCEDSDSGGHDVPKERMARLREIGVVQSKGFGRDQITSFGDYVLGRAAGEDRRFPLKTAAEYNAESAARAAALQAKQAGEEQQ